MAPILETIRRIQGLLLLRGRFSPHFARQVETDVGRKAVRGAQIVHSYRINTECLFFPHTSEPLVKWPLETSL